MKEICCFPCSLCTECHVHEFRIRVIGHTRWIRICVCVSQMTVRKLRLGTYPILCSLCRYKEGNCSPNLRHTLSSEDKVAAEIAILLCLIVMLLAMRSFSGNPRQDKGRIWWCKKDTSVYNRLFRQRFEWNSMDLGSGSE